MAHGLDELVDRQFRRWEAARRSAQGETRRPCVAFSRLPGAGAAELGQRIAERLGYAFFGIELVDRIARETGHQRELVAGVDEHVRSAIDRFVADALREERFTEGDYLRAVVRTVTTLAERGGAVILGRGSACIVRPERALRVLVVAPEPMRAERLAKRLELSPEQARERLAAEDAERRAFYGHHFALDPDAPSLYDLTLNLGSFSMEAASELVVKALRARFGVH